MTIYWTAVIAITLHGQPYGVCTMSDMSGRILATEKAFPATSDRGVGIARFDVDPELIGKVKFECQG
jgi:hypothetical protein